MSWHYLQEQEGESLVDICSGGEPFAPLRSKITHAEFYCNGKLMESYLDSLSGTMLPPLTVNLGEERSMSSQVDFPVKTSQSLALEQGLLDLEADSGKSSPGSSEKSGQDTFLSRTPRISRTRDWKSFWKTFGKWGTMRDGALSVLTMSVPHINVTASGLWPTPTTSEVVKIPATANYGQVGLNNHPRIRGYPTRDRIPKTHGGKSTRQTFQTPTAMEGADCGSKWDALKKLDKGGRIQRQMATLQMPETIQTERAQLNPGWVEWLMGWPIGWTDLKPLEMGKFQQWLNSHGRF